MGKEELIQRVYSRIEELPTLPVVIPKLLQLLEEDKSNVAGVTRIISNDPALTAKILKVANSAYYGFSKKISQLEHAVALLGFNMVKSLALSIGVIKCFPDGSNTQYFSHDGLWLHSLTVGTVMNEIAKKHVKNNRERGYFVVGLLHDIGKLVLDQFFPEEFQEVLRRANENNQVKLHVAEREVIGIDHCEMAEMVLERWNFPPEIVNPISSHHKRTLPEGVSETDTLLLRISNILAQDINIGNEGNPEPNPLRDEDLAVLNMDQESYREMKKGLRGIRDRIDSLFWSIC